MKTCHPLERFAGVLLAMLICLVPVVARAESAVTLMRTPNGGIQPQAVLDKKGVLHLIYLKGDAGAEDIFYVRQEPGKSGFSAPIRVNSEPGSAVATGTIRGAQLAVGKNGHVHVAWNGSMKFKADRGMPMLYARLNDAGAAFEAQRNLMTFTATLDGGGTLAADDKGNVYVAWHGNTPETKTGEAGRAVYITHSTDDGKTFAPEKPAVSTPTGACACCGMRALVDSRGNVFALYRAATQVLNRDIILLSSHDQGGSFQATSLDKWKIGKCPMSSESLYETSKGLVGAWEVNDQVHFATIDAASGKLLSAPTPAPSESGKSKHPVVASNAKGEMLLVWTEGTGWQKGGSLGWQVYDASGKPTADKGRAAGVPVWGLATAFARPDGGFVVIY